MRPSQFQVFSFRVVETKELFNCVCALFWPKELLFWPKELKIGWKRIVSCLVSSIPLLTSLSLSEPIFEHGFWPTEMLHALSKPHTWLRWTWSSIHAVLTVLCFRSRISNICQQLKSKTRDWFLTSTNLFQFIH
jgi:hypothetical protein